MAKSKTVQVRALSGFKYDGRGVQGASRDDKGKFVPGETIEVSVAFAAELVANGKAEYLGDAPKAEKLSTKNAGALVG